MRGRGAILVAAAALMGSAGAGQEAPPVTLSAREGPMAVTGRLVGYDGDTYRIDTPHGAVTLDAAAVTCEGAGCPDRPTLVIEGAPALADVLVPALIEAFAVREGHRLERGPAGPGATAYEIEAGSAEMPERLRIVLRRSGTRAGLAALADGRAQAALTLWSPRGASTGTGARPHVLALDALVPVVSPRNPLRALSPAEVASLFAGEVADWAEIGGEPGPVRLHLTRAGEGPAGAFEDLVTRPAGLALAPGITRHEDAEALSRAVAREPGAIGIATLSRARLAKPLALRGACGLVSRPEPDAVRAGDWPLTLPLRLTLRPGPLTPLARAWVAFATSPAAHRVVRRAGLLDGAPRTVPLSRQGDRLAAAILRAEGEASLDTLRGAVMDLQGLTRLTPTFRFEGGTRLDARSREAVERLARRIASGRHDGQTLVFVGFGDATGAPERTLELSRRRARMVLEAVRAGAPRRDRGPLLVAQGHGAALPAACGDTAAGRRLNRRVELWTR